MRLVSLCPFRALSSFYLFFLGREKDTKFGGISSWKEALEELQCKVGGQGGLRVGR